MDLEMTGLEPSRHVIVEIATLVTDDDLKIVAEGPDLVIHQDEAALAQMDQVVVEMHTRSGLLEAIRASTITLADAGAQTLEFIKTHVTEARRVPLCGNSIGMDRRFLAAYLPDIEEYLHYRSVDVSTIKELVKRWYPGLNSTRPRKTGAHRALDDIVESIAELTYYREHVFVGSVPDIGAPDIGV
jgi:oligoribonuclease